MCGFISMPPSPNQHTLYGLLGTFILGYDYFNACVERPQWLLKSLILRILSENNKNAFLFKILLNLICKKIYNNLKYSSTRKIKIN